MSDEGPVVKLNQGQLLGRALETSDNVKYYQFKGIPYAKSPVGDLRFKAPQPPESWDGVRDGTKDCNICAQLDRATSKVAGDEDCLFLNVFTPRVSDACEKPLPVMVYIHGGGFVFGSGTEVDRTGPDYLLRHNTVVVSINYRLGVFGFLCLDLPEAQGNMGLKDQVQALKWVKENITQFGGDPENVTIFGVSAGGASVEYLQLSPMAKGLFHKAIIQSGSALNAWAHNTSSNIIQLAFRMAKLRGTSLSDEKELLKYFKSLSTEELLEAYTKAVAVEEYKGGIHFGFVPTVETDFKESPAFLSVDPYVLLSRGEFNKVPLISGFCQREGLLMVSFAPQLVEKIAKEKRLGQFLPFDLDEQQRFELERRLKLHYLDSSEAGEEDDGFVLKFFTDVDFLGGIWVATKLKARASSPAFLYEFAYDGKLNYLKKKCGINRRGACHGDDGGYLVRSDILPDDVSEADELTRSRMVLMWTNFAKFGEPTPETSDLLPTQWKPLSEDSCGYLEIDQELTMKHLLYPQRLKLFEHLYEKHRL